MINKEILSLDGIIINVNQYNDYSAISNIITSKGVFNVIVKNAFKFKNDLKPLIIPFNYINLEYNLTNKEKFINAKYVKTIKDYSLGFSNLQNNLFLQCISQIILNLCLFNETFNLENLKLILDSLFRDVDLLSILLLFIGSIYYELGLNQNVSSCSLCHKVDNIVSYSINNGGFICKNCLNKDKSFKYKDKIELYIFKYVFSDINKDNLSKKVDKIFGIKVLKELISYLENYFEIKKIKSIDNFISYLLNEK